MSRVFVAEELALGRQVLVKVLAPELAKGLSAERSAREAKLAARLQDPRIVPVLAAGGVGNLPYHTMPFVEGESLRARMARAANSGQATPVAEAIAVLRDVALALEYAHAHDVVHRDIKPENVLLSGRTAVVSDFGVSLGTPAHMAPEQAVGDAVDHRADLYAWGVMAYELLTGTHPFAGKTSAQQLIAAHLSEKPTPPSTRRNVPAGLDALVMRSLDPALSAVLPLRVSSADVSLGYLREGMVDLIAAKLVRSPRTVDQRSLLAAWRRTGGSAAQDIDHTAAARVAAGLGAGRLIEGDIVGNGNQLTVSASLSSAPNGSRRGRASATGVAIRLPVLVDSVMAQLLAIDAGESEQRVASLRRRAQRAWPGERRRYRRRRTHRTCGIDSAITRSTMELGATPPAEPNARHGWVTAVFDVAQYELARGDTTSASRVVAQLRSLPAVPHDPVESMRPGRLGSIGDRVRLAGNLVASRLLERAGNLRGAYDAAQRWAPTTGPEQGILYATYLREQGRLGGLVGDREAATAAYRRYLRWRARHEPVLDRDVATVRAELQKLERQSSGR